MLKIVVELRDVFFAFEVEDANYFRDLDRVPEHSDFGVCKKVVEFLEKFKNVDKHLCVWEVEPEFCLMARSMREKYDKYWGRFDKLNDFMYFAVMLDPTMKSSFIGHAFRKMIVYNITKENPMEKEVFETKMASMVQKVEKRLDVLFRAYKERFDKASNGEDLTCDVGNDFLGEFLHVEESNSVAIETEFKSYLNKPNILPVVETKRHSVSNCMTAKDILAIQISTVASESALSTSGRVLDPYRTNLSSPIVEALICTQDWVKKSRKPIIDDIDDILKDDDIAIGIKLRRWSEVLGAATVVLGGGASGWWFWAAMVVVLDGAVFLDGINGSRRKGSRWRWVSTLMGLWRRFWINGDGSPVKVMGRRQR
ncbi:hypothetical protein OSB04_003327 [Centaurea solstitialis]|uniref:Transposase n=1 Tax=Centaurea solstitialis TaxID=347529 RepID=A0AA38U761_9ASTR|nr:hypothetical protein OSB04_003327 [Centaurea solstitialis]